MLVVALGFAAGAGHADDVGEVETAIDRDVENPLGRDWFVKIQSNTYLLDVESFDTHRLQPTLKIQPRLSVPLTEEWLLVTRPSWTAFESTPYTGDDGSLARADGVGDLELPFTISPELGPNWALGLGPTFVLPTATSRETGKGKWQAGPAAVAAWQDPNWLVGLFAQQWWSYAGSGMRSNVSQMKVQYFLTRYFRDGWNVGMSPTIAVNWKADRGQQLTFPVGLGVGKVLLLGDGWSVKLGLQLEVMPVHPDDFGQEANLQFTVTPVAPQPFHAPVFGRAGRPGP